MIVNLDNLLNLANDIFQKKELKPVFSQVAATARYLWERGWAERNAGNFSLNVTGFFHDRELEHLASYPFYPLAKCYPDLVRKLILVSGAGTRMRDIAREPMDHVCFVYISDSGSAFHIIERHHETASLKPTSELATHLSIQQQLIQKHATEQVVLHAHVTELIALTQLPMFHTREAVNGLLWQMHPETMLYLPEGVGFIPYTLAGTEKIAGATLAGFEKHRVVLWEKHGCMAVGRSMDEAFDHLDILAKAAGIYFLAKSSGTEPAGLSTQQIDEIRNSL